MKLAYSIGDSVFEKSFGKGVVKKIDEASKDFTYFVDFHAGVAWLPEWRLKPASEIAE